MNLGGAGQDADIEVLSSGPNQKACGRRPDFRVGEVARPEQGALLNEATAPVANSYSPFRTQARPERRRTRPGASSLALMEDVPVSDKTAAQATRCLPGRRFTQAAPIRRSRTCLPVGAGPPRRVSFFLTCEAACACWTAVRARAQLRATWLNSSLPARSLASISSRHRSNAPVRLRANGEVTMSALRSAAFMRCRVSCVSVYSMLAASWWNSYNTLHQMNLCIYGVHRCWR